MTSKPGKPRLINFVWVTTLAVVVVALLLLAYALSYPIVLKASTNYGEYPPKIMAYAPLEGVIYRYESAFDAMLSWSYCFDAGHLIIFRSALHRLDE